MSRYVSSRDRRTLHLNDFRATLSAIAIQGIGMTKRTGLARRNAERAGEARWHMGADYEPLHRVQDVRSSGRKSRLPYQGRVVHLLSDLEVRAFRHFQWEQAVFGIEEQFYLEIEDTTRIGTEAGARHPLVVGTSEPFEMSTDLVVYYHTEDGPRRLARQMKYAKDLELGDAAPGRARHSVELRLEKLEIERRYWAERNVHWAVLTERELSQARTRNIEHLLGSELDAGRPQGFWDSAMDRVRDALVKGDGLRAVDLARRLETDGFLDEGDFRTALRHLCSMRQVAFDMETLFDLDRPANDFEFVVSDLRRAA